MDVPDPSRTTREDAPPQEAAEEKVALVRGGAARLLSFGSITLLSVLSTALLTRHLGVVEFGDYTTVTSLVAIVAVVTDSGMSNIGVREYATLGGEHRRVLLADLLGLRIALSLVGIGLVALLAWALGFGAAIELGAVAASLATVALVIQHTLTIPLTSDLRLGWLSALELLRQAVTVAAVVVLVLLHAGVFPLLTTTLIANLVLIPVTAPLVRGQISLRPAVDLRRWWALAGPTVAFSLAVAVGVIYIYAAQVLTHVVAGGYESGLFSISFRVFVVAAGIPGLLTGAALPVLSRAARDDRDRLGYILQRMFEAALIGGLGIAVTLSAGAGFIVHVIDDRAPRAVPVLELQAFALIASFVASVWAFGLISLRDHRGLLVSNALALVTSVVLTLVLAATDGAMGAAIATVCGESALALGTLAAVVHGRPEYVPRLDVVARVLVAGALSAAVLLVPGIPSLPRAVIAFVVYVAGILLLRALPPEFRVLLPGRGGR